MKISHEVPLCLLEKSREFNDYDYALVHLFDQYPEYYEFYKESLRMGRVVYLDNSLFELGKSFDPDKFAYYVNELSKINADNLYYVVPDIWNEAQDSILSYQEFTHNYRSLPGHKIAVCQGYTDHQLRECFDFYKEAKADVIAVSFGSAAFGNCYTNTAESMNNRIEFVKSLDLTNIKLHLLGCALPQEVKAYKDINIFSIDTSNPIMHGIFHQTYRDTGMNYKLATRVVDVMDIPYKDVDLNSILYNVEMFRKFTI